MSIAPSIPDVINTWFRETCGGGPLARDTDAYNQVTGALPDLIARLQAGLAPDAAPAATPPAPPASADDTPAENSPTEA